MQIYKLVWLFLVYSFLGWILETVFATIKQRKMTNRGLINGPFCVIYGISGVLISAALSELTGFWLFFFAMIYSSAVEWFGGHLIEWIYRERWWSYEGIPWNLDGYISLPTSLLWGVLGFFVVRFGNGFLLEFFDGAPFWFMKLVLWIIGGCLAADGLFSLIVGKCQGNWTAKIQEMDDNFSALSTFLKNKIVKAVNTRIHNAYPSAKAVIKVHKKEKSTVFAEGCSFYKIIWLFFVGAFLGDIVETIFCRLTAGVWMSRSSVVWGPFSLVWGIGIAAGNAMLYKYKDRSDGFLFGMGTLIGGAYEYFCSVFTEVVFGKVFWDYSNIPFNLGGRVNLLYCFFWGIAAVVWFKLIYTRLAGWIEKIPKKTGTVLSWIFIVFMLTNVSVSSLALLRHDQRSQHVPAQSAWQRYMDTHYDDVRIDRIYPNAKEADECQK